MAFLDTEENTSRKEAGAVLADVTHTLKCTFSFQLWVWLSGAQSRESLFKETPCPLYQATVDMSVSFPQLLWLEGKCT